MKKFFLIIALLFAALLIFFWQTSLWDGKSKFALVVNKKDVVEVTLFNPKTKGVTTIVIPGATQVKVAGGLGSWKLSSVWQLGINEKRVGELLVKTVVKNFSFPVFAWRDQVSGATNLRPGDRLKLTAFRLTASRNNKSEINLSDYENFLKEKTLLDGSRGYVVSGKPPSKLLAIFTDEGLAEKKLKAGIVLGTNAENINQEEISRVIEVMGIKVAAVVKEETPGDFICLVKAKEKSLLQDLARIFSCQKDTSVQSDNFDLKLILGNKFVRNF